MKIAVGMSGGVDSTMAAWILRQQGHEVIGLTMQIWDGSLNLPDLGRSGCYGPGEARDLISAKAAADQIGIPHYVLALSSEYKRVVLDHFRSEYRAGRTPNPCVVCNHLMKFGVLLERAREDGHQFDYFATGHYARLVPGTSGTVRLLRGVDTRKDQSYFLSRVDQKVLAEVLFPLGNMTKSEVVALAQAQGFLEAASRPESQDFIESPDYTPLFNATDNCPGPILDSDTGRVLGEHKGIIHYTVGQRAGINSNSRRYVLSVDAARNTLVVGPRESLLTSACRLTDMRWVSGNPPTSKMHSTLQLRYHGVGVEATLEPQSDGDWLATFDIPQGSVTPGQAGVVYDGEECLGSGWIRTV